MNRRSFIRTTALAGTTAATGIPVQPVAAATPAETQPAAEPTEVTQILARYWSPRAIEDLPEAARKEVARSLLNWMGVAVGGSRHEAVQIALAAVTPFAGPPQAACSAARSGWTC